MWIHNLCQRLTCHEHWDSSDELDEITWREWYTRIGDTEWQCDQAYFPDAHAARHKRLEHKYWGTSWNYMYYIVFVFQYFRGKKHHDFFKVTWSLNLQESMQTLNEQLFLYTLPYWTQH